MFPCGGIEYSRPVLAVFRLEPGFIPFNPVFGGFAGWGGFIEIGCIDIRLQPFDQINIFAKLSHMNIYSVLQKNPRVNSTRGFRRRDPVRSNQK